MLAQCTPLLLLHIMCEAKSARGVRRLHAALCSVWSARRVQLGQID